MSHRAPTDRPNVLLINCDDLGYGDLGCYGSPLHRTPAIDALAAEGIRLNDFYMASPYCSPSRASMLTGCYPRRIGCDSFDGQAVLFPSQPLGLNPSETTIAKLLGGRGYATKLVGKWHCGDQKEFLPTRHGFDSYFGLPYSNDMGRQAIHVPQRPPLPLMRDEEVIEAQPQQAPLTERYVQECVSFLRQNRDRPFFLYLAHMQVHLPLYVPPRFERASLNGRYGAAVECIDWSTAALMYELRRLGLESNTIVIFTSDNGGRAREGGSNAPLRGTKGTCWEGGQRVPCILHWPGVIPAGRTSSDLVTSMDFFPTIANLAGADLPKDRIIDGKDIRPIILGQRGAGSPHEAFFYYLLGNLHAVRCGRWKMHVWREGSSVSELYDLREDIGETTNVFHRQGEVVRDLMRFVEHCRCDLGDDVVGAKGANRREIGRVPHGTPLATYDPACPYLEPMYDLDEAG